MKTILLAVGTLCLMAGCSSKVASSKGIVSDATMNTVTIVTDKNDTLSFSTIDANKDEELKVLIDYISKYNDDSTEFFDLAFDYFGMRGCYEVLYENEDNEIVYTKQSALNTIGIFDYSTPVKQIGQLRKWTERDKNGADITIVELTTINGKRYYSPTPNDYKKLQEDKQKFEKSKWNMLPCIAIENEMGLSSFELVVSLICAYERVIQNSRNTFQYNDDAKLKITGYAPQNELMTTKLDKEGNPELDENGQPKQVVNKAREEEDKALLKMQVFYTPDNSGDIAWVEKSVQDTALENHKKTLIDLIAMISGVPNITDLGFTNADNASALDRKFFALEQMITDADKHFKQAILRRWETIIDRINKEEKTVRVKFDDGKIATYDNTDLDQLEHAYAITVHKSQGSEFDVVILVASQSAPMLLTRNLIYTAMTRAKKLLIVIGSQSVVSYMIQNNTTRQRNTGLTYKLEKIGE